MDVKNQRPLIIALAIIFISILFLYVWISGITLKEKPTTEIPSLNMKDDQKNDSQDISRVVHESKEEIYRIDPSIFVTKWELNSSNNDVNLYAIAIHNESEIKGLQGRKNGRFSIYIIRDTKFEKDMTDVQEQLIQLRKNPDYKIATTAMILDTFHDPPQNYIDIYVDEITPENKKLDNTVMQGWKTIVHVLSSPPTPATIKTNPLPTSL